MEEKWRDNLIKITPYTAGEQSDEPDLIKLNANENAYPPSPLAAKAIREFDTDDLRKYPEISSEPLRTQLAEYYGLEKEQIFVGNGSDDVLAAAFRAFFNSEKPILFPDITYSFYPVWCSLLKIPYKTKPLKSDFTIDINDYKEPNGGIIFPNPNAPTGIGMTLENVEKIVSGSRESIVIIDETYVDFGGESALKILNKYKNLVLTRTFSKSRSLAGMRIGFAMADKELISYMNAVKDSYNSYPLDRVAAAAGAAALRDEKYFCETTAKIIKTREETARELRENGFEVFESQTNFLFTKHKEVSSEEIFEYLRSRNIFIRHFSAPVVSDYLRITIGTDEEMKKTIKEIKSCLECNKSPRGTGAGR